MNSSSHADCDTMIPQCKTFIHVSKIIRFIIGHRVQFGVTYVMEILPISSTI